MQMKHKNLESLIAEASQFYVLPSIYRQFNQKLEDPNTTNEQLADVIKLDPNLSAFLLRLVNSAFYGFSREIHSLNQAMAIIGRRELSTIVLGRSIIHSFNESSLSNLTLNTHWETSLAAALFSKILSKKIGKKSLSHETLFVAGLIHKIGHLILWDAYPKLLQMQNQTDDFASRCELERKELGYDYAEAGALLLQHWRLPEVLINTTRNHLAKNLKEQHYSVNIIYLARSLAEHTYHASEGAFETERFRQILDNLVLENAQIDEVVAEVNKEFSELKSTFLH